MKNLIVASFAFAITSNVCLAEDVMRHEFTVAANPSLLIDDKFVDSVLAGATKLVSSRYSNWDTACPDVEFVRKVTVIEDPNLPTTGTMSQITTQLKALAPQANAIVVSGIKCSGVTAAGCGYLNNEPLVVGTYKGYNHILWLHERGHNMGLNHSAESPNTPASAGELLGNRVMFWRLGNQSLGKTVQECSAFHKKKFASIKRIQNGAVIEQGPEEAAPAVGLVDDTFMAQLDPSKQPPVEAPPSPESYGAAGPDPKPAELSDKAFDVVGSPWLDGAPIDAINSLSDEDVESIRTMLKGEPNAYWQQGMQVLGLRGKPSDSTVIENAVSLPIPAIGGDQSEEDKEAYRNLLSIKQVAPNALGILANKTKSEQAVEALNNLTDPNQASKLVPPGLSNDLSKSAISGLSIAGTEKSDKLLDEKLQSFGANSAIRAEPDEIRSWQLQNDAVKKLGIERALRDNFRF